MKKLIFVLMFTLLCSQVSIFAWGIKRASGYQQLSQQNYPLTQQWAKNFNITNPNDKEFLQAVENNENIDSYLKTIKNPQALLAGAKIAAEQGNSTLQTKISNALTARFKARS